MHKLPIAADRTANLPISIPKETCEAIRTAAWELAHFLRRITGADFAICETCTGAAIFLAIDPALGEEAYRIRCLSSGLYITGGSGRGVLYGVYGFLETVLGVRFYAHDVTKVPKCEVLTLDEMDITDAPAFEYRQIDYPLCNYPEWRARNRINIGKDEMLPFGGGHSYALNAHSFSFLVDPELYFDEHPEYFSMVDGKRIKEHTQLCLTNPEVIAIATERAKQYLRENPSATLIHISQNDCYNPCQCPDCARMDAENGSHAGSLIHFVNAVAAGIEEEFPHVIVETLSYQYTRTPPKLVKPRHNVCIRLCTIECCFSHPLESCSHVASFANNQKTSARTFQEDLIGWGKICRRIYIWDYVTNYAYYWLPFPNFHVIGPNMRFFAANGVKGSYEEGNYQSVSPDMTEMRTWLLAKLLWNPDFDVEHGILEFTEAVYGPAAAEIRAYIKLLENRVTEGHIHFGIFESPSVSYLDRKTLSSAQALFAAAQAKPLTLSQRIYVEKAALSIEFAAVAQDILRGNADPDRIDALFAKARTLGISHISEALGRYPTLREFLHRLSAKTPASSTADSSESADQ